MGKRNSKHRKSLRKNHELSEIDPNLEVDLERLLEAIQAPYFEPEQSSGRRRKHRKRISNGDRFLSGKGDDGMEYDDWDSRSWND